MKRTHFCNALIAALAFGSAGMSSPVLAQTSTDTMQQVREGVRADKRAFFAKQMVLTDAQAKVFWPLFDAYQKDLLVINRRSTVALVDYVNVQDRLSDAAADQFLREISSIARDRAKLNDTYLKRFLKVLPGKQVARFFQLENKIRAVEDYDLAMQMPLVK